MTFLIVDDSVVMRRIIKNTLTLLGYSDFFEAENGLIAFEIIKISKIDFIITDWNMPVVNGLEFVKKVREVNQEIPIVMVTTECSKSSVISALKAGVNNYIVKPFTPQVLQNKLQETLGE